MFSSPSLPFLFPCSWDPEFKTFREKFNVATENTTLDEYLSDFDDDTDSHYRYDHQSRDQDSITGPVKTFMASRAGAGIGPVSIHQSEVVGAFCSNPQSDLALSRNGEEVHERTVAIVYESENKPSRDPRQRLKYPLPLTHEGLLDKLSEPRFIQPAHPPETKQDAAIDADRRTIYIHTLDPLIIAILAKTTSRLQTPVIQRVIFQHLTGHTSFQVHTATRGFKTFSMELSASYFRLRKSEDTEGLIEYDPRQRWDKTGPLRATLFSPADPTEEIPTNHCSFRIYETQISIAVTGIDHYRWTAWGISDDSWFIPDETIASKYYHGPETGSQPDPLSAGELDVNPPEPDPRQYYLRIFQVRTGMVAREWEYTLYALQQEVHKISVNPLFDFPEQSFQSKDGRDKIRRLATWNSEMTTLVGTMLHSLSQWLTAWEVFQKTDIGYFIDRDVSCDTCGPSSSLGRNHNCTKEKEKMLSTLHVIEKTFLNLQVTHGEMERLKSSLEDQRRALARGEENYSTFVQQRTGEDLKLLTWVTIGWSPVIIATGICSAQDGIFPFKNNIWDFIAALLIVGSLVGLTILILRTRQGSNIVEWRILSPSTGPSPGSPVGNININNRAKNKDDDREDNLKSNMRSRTMSFASSTARAFAKSGRRWTADSGLSSGGSVASKGGFELNRFVRDGIHEVATGGRFTTRGALDAPVRRTYYPPRKKYNPSDEPDGMV